MVVHNLLHPVHYRQSRSAMIRTECCPLRSPDKLKTAWRKAKIFQLNRRINAVSRARVLRAGLDPFGV